MTDDTPKKRPRWSKPASADSSRARRTPSPGDVPPGPPSDDPDAALQRLESMGSPGAPPATPVPPPSSPPVASGMPAGAQSGRARPMGSATRTPRSRPRPAAARSGTRVVARIAAPVVFLIAVIALLGIAVQSGVVGGADEPTPTPTPKVTKTKGGSTTPEGTKKYTVKSGDSLSTIAVKFDTTVSELETLNPKLASNTLVVGVKILVPTQ